MNYYLLFPQKKKIFVENKLVWVELADRFSGVLNTVMCKSKHEEEITKTGMFESTFRYIT